MQRELLRYITGNRRFWTITFTGDNIKKTWDLNDDVIYQIWAEALVLYRIGETLYLEDDIAKVTRDCFSSLKL